MLFRGDILRINKMFHFCWSLAVSVIVVFYFLLQQASPVSLHVYTNFFHQMQEFWTTGVLTAKTRCWAQGMDGWRPLQAIPQLKWCLLATGQAVMNESDLATLILNMLLTMCSYYPSRWEPLEMSLWLCVVICLLLKLSFMYYIL